MNKLIHSSLLTAVLVIVVYAVVIGFSDGTSIIDAVISLDWQIWVVILLLSFGNYFLRYLRWFLYLKKDLPSSLTHTKHFAIYLAGFALTMTPGKAGEMMRCFYLNQYGVANDKTMGAFFVERIMDLFVILIMAAAVIGVFSMDQAMLAMGGALVMIVAAVALVHVPTDKIFTSRSFHALPHKIQKLIRFVESSLDSARGFFSFRFLLMGFTLGLIAWGLEGYGLFVVIQHYSLDQVTLITAIGIYGFAMLLGALSFLPGGVGGAEAAMAFMLVKAGFGMPEAIAITFICRLATLWFAILLGIICTAWLSFSGLKPMTHKA